MKRVSGETLFTKTSYAQAYSYDLTLDQFDGLAVQVIYSDAAITTAKTFLDANVNTTTNRITITAHGFVTGLKVAATTTGTLPGGTSATNYYVIVVDADTIKLATSIANATAGTEVDITSAAGGGTHTLTPAAAGSNVLKLQVSNDGTNFDDLGSYTVTIATTPGTKVWDLGRIYPRIVRILFTPSAGAITFSAVLNAKAD